jgi:hypothetical protein
MGFIGLHGPSGLSAQSVVAGDRRWKLSACYRACILQGIYDAGHAPFAKVYYDRTAFECHRKQVAVPPGQPGRIEHI